MGKQNTSMKIQWNGNTGGVVGYSIRGHHYTRSLADNIRNPRTEAQLEQRAKFAYVSQVAASFGAAYLEGYRHYNTTLNQRANFSKNLYHVAVSGNRTDGFTVDYTKVRPSNGNLMNPYSLSATVDATSHKATLAWSDNSGVGNATANDLVAVCVYNSTRGEYVLDIAAATRASENAELTYPTAWAGDTLYIYVWMSNNTSESLSMVKGPMVG